MSLRDINFLLSDTDIQLFDYDGSGNTIYIGNAQPGSASSDSVWRIKQLNYNGSNQITSIKFPNGSPAYNFIYDNRTTLTYS